MSYAKVSLQVRDLVEEAAFMLPDDVRLALKRARMKEKHHRVKAALKLILDNADTAVKERLAICQDTGLPVVFVTVGRDIKFNAELLEAIRAGVQDGYAEHYLRPSCVGPLERGASTYDVHELHVDFNKDITGLHLTILPKGFGSENKARLKMFNPTATIEDIEAFVVESVKLAGPDSCPPFFVGVGIGSTSDGALLLAKKALLERVDKMSARERHFLAAVNKIGTGVMGLGGATALSVKIKESPTHIAGLPVGVNISCHALRRAHGTIDI